MGFLSTNIVSGDGVSIFADWSDSRKVQSAIEFVLWNLVQKTPEKRDTTPNFGNFADFIEIYFFKEHFLS